MEVDRVAESSPVAVAVGSLLERLDAAVDALRGGVGDAVNDRVHNSEHVVPQGLRDLHGSGDRGRIRPVAESAPRLPRPASALVVPESASGVLDCPDLGDMEGAVAQRAELSPECPRHALGVLEPEVLRSLERVVTFLDEALVLCATSHVDGVAEQLRDVEPVEAELRLDVGDMPDRRVDERVVHVHRDDLDALELFGAQPLEERVDRCLPTAIGDVQNAPVLDIRDHADVLVAALERGLIDAESRRVDRTAAFDSACDRSLLDPRHLVPGQPQVASDGAHTRFLQPVDDSALKSFGEPGVGIGPRDNHLADAMFGAVHPRHVADDPGLVLQQIKVPPLATPMIVDSRCAAALGAGSIASRERNEDVDDLLAVVDHSSCHLPAIWQRHRLRDQLLGIHPPNVVAASSEPTVGSAERSHLSKRLRDSPRVTTPSPRCGRRYAGRIRQSSTQNPEAPEWVKYCRRPRSTSSVEEPGASPGAVESELTPDDALANAHATLQRELASELLEAIHGCSPTFFEHLVVKLLVKMGYGGTFDDAARSLGKSGDGGIDGIIKEDRLGLDAIYIQAKRWQNTVGRPDVQAFVGALTGQRARKGVFITTSSYSREAHAYVQNLDAKVVLIDGEMLTDFMIEVGLGVSLEQTFEVKRIDTDFFDE